MQRTHRPCDVFQKQGVIFMYAIQHHARGVLSAAAIATAALVGGTFATPASAQWASDNYAPYAAPATGVVVGTLAGVGLYNGWYGSSAAATSLGATAASSAVAGGVIGVGAAALVDAAIQPCRGFHAMFDLSHGQCVNGEYVGYRNVEYRERGPMTYRERHMRRAR